MNLSTKQCTRLKFIIAEMATCLQNPGFPMTITAAISAGISFCTLLRSVHSHPKSKLLCYNLHSKGGKDMWFIPFCVSIWNQDKKQSLINDFECDLIKEVFYVTHWNLKHNLNVPIV